MGSTGSSLTSGRHVSHSKPMSAPQGNPRGAWQEMPNSSMTAPQNARGSVHTSRDKKEPRIQQLEGKFKYHYLQLLRLDTWRTQKNKLKNSRIQQSSTGQNNVKQSRAVICAYINGGYAEETPNHNI